MTLLELMLALIVVALIGSIALPSYRAHVERTRVSQAVADIKRIEMAIERFVTDRGTHPASLADLGGATPVDPWGRPYEYVNLRNSKGNGTARKDKSLAPLNSDFDLYSVGCDGETKAQLSHATSRDDVVRARDGRFVGLASDFDP